MKNRILVILICIFGAALVVESAYIVKTKIDTKNKMKRFMGRKVSAPRMHALKSQNQGLVPEVFLPNAGIPAQPAGSSERDPLREMEMMQRSMNKMFIDLAQNQTQASKVFFAQRMNQVEVDMEIVDTPESIVIRAELPGMEKKDINIEINGNLLTISGERKAEENFSAQGYSRVERSFGAFSKTIALPQEARKQDVKAEYKNGVLLIRVLKLKPVKKAVKTKIEIM